MVSSIKKKAAMYWKDLMGRLLVFKGTIFWFILFNFELTQHDGMLIFVIFKKLKTLGHGN